MKKRIMKIAGISIFVLALIANLQSSLFNYGLKTHNAGALYAQTHSGGSSGCYQLVTLDCGMGLGQWTYCNFTGVYGAPYNCTGVDCYGKFSSRSCVQG